MIVKEKDTSGEWKDQVFHYWTNHRGDVVSIRDNEGKEVGSYQYDAYGNVLSVEGDITKDNPIRYAGYYYDEETKNYYLQARYYNPTNGAFLALDPHPGDDDEPLSQNGYTYGNNNPIKYIDINGQYALPVINIWNIVTAIASVFTLSYYLAVKIKGFLLDIYTTIRKKYSSLSRRPKYKHSIEVHHIVAQKAKAALPARRIINHYGISVHDYRNLVPLKTGLHRRLHTKLYYNGVNEILRAAYKGKNKRSRVLSL